MTELCKTLGPNDRGGICDTCGGHLHVSDNSHNQTIEYPKACTLSANKRILTRVSQYNMQRLNPGQVSEDLTDK